MYNTIAKDFDLKFKYYINGSNCFNTSAEADNYVWLSHEKDELL